MKNSKKKIFHYHSDIKVDRRYATMFEKLVFSHDFLDDVKKIRKDFHIEVDGISEFPENGKGTVFEINFDVPEHLQTNKFWNKVELLCEKYGFDADTWFVVFEEFIVFGHYSHFNFGKGYAVFDFKNFPKNKGIVSVHIKNKPIGIFIDRNTSLTELRDLISKVYESEILPLQELNIENREIQEDLIPVYNYIKNNLTKNSITLAGEINRRFKKDWDYTRVDKIKREKGYKNNP